MAVSSLTAIAYLKRILLEMITNQGFASIDYLST